MPLIGNDRATGRAKSFDEFSDGDREKWIPQVLIEQRENVQAGTPVDTAALKRCDELARTLNDQGLIDRIAQTRQIIAEGPQRIEAPRGSAR
jgi:hypothetical protein